MNRIVIIALIGVITFACKEEKVGLDKLKSNKELLQSQYAALGDEIAKLDAEIAKYDTVKRYVLVTTTPIESNTFVHFFEVQGAIEADKNVVLYPEIGGIIKGIRVREGERVQKGQVLIDLDIEVIELQIKEVESSLELAKTTYERQARLWDQKIGSEMQYLQAKNQKESLETNLATLNAQMRKNRIEAPFDGVVDEIWAKVGEMTSPMTEVVRLVNLDRVYIKADVSEAYLGKISKGTDVEVFFPAFDFSVSSTVDFLGNFINPNNRTFSIQVQVPNKENRIKPNLMAYVRIKDFEQKDALIIPDRLIQENPNGGKYVFVAKESKGVTSVEKKELKIGLSYKNKSMVIDGVDAATILVDKGARSIKDGQKVQVVL